MEAAEQKNVAADPQSLDLPEAMQTNPFIKIAVSGTTEPVDEITAENDVPAEDDGDDDGNGSGDADDGDEMDLEEEIELWDLCTREELYGLLRDSPERMLPVFEDREELANKYDCQVRRDEGDLRIKFRVYPEDRWTEVGYFEKYDDQAVYDEFSCTVQRLLERSRGRKDPSDMSRKEFLESQNNRDNSHVNSEFGNDAKPCFEATKDTLDRLKGEKHRQMRAEDSDNVQATHPTTVSPMDLKISAADDDGKIRPVIRKKTAEEQEHYHRHNYTYDPCGDYDASCYDENSDAGTESMEIDCSMAGLLAAYLDQLMEKMSMLVPEWINRETSSIGPGHQDQCAGAHFLIHSLERRKAHTPTHLLKPFQDMLGQLKMASMNEYYMQMVQEKFHSVPPILHPIYDKFLNQILESESLVLGKQFPHERICSLLGLKRTDVNLLEEHCIDLRKYWNNYIQE